MRCPDEIRISSPCSARWSQMKGDDRVRFCGLCKKNVYDFSRLTRAEITALLEREPRPCARLFRRADGKLLTADCPVGRARARTRLLGAMLTAASFFLGFFGVISGFGIRYEGAGGATLDAASVGPRDWRLEAQQVATFGQNSAP